MDFSDKSHRDDSIALLREQTDGRLVSRRAMLAAAAALGLSATAFRLTPAAAAPGDIVLANWGSDMVNAMKLAFADPYQASPGAGKVTIDPTGPSSGKIKAMVDSRRVTWDVCDRNLAAAAELGQQGLLEKIDYTIVDKAKYRPEHAAEYGAASYTYAYVRTWNKKALGRDVPASWAEFWDVARFPGRRTLRRHIDGMLEVALMADGVKPADLYPLDVDRAFEKIRQIKQHVIFYTNNAEAVQLFRNGEVNLGCIVSTRAAILKKEMPDEIELDFGGGVAFVASWIVPKGNPAGRKVFEFIASTQDARKQVELFKMVGNGPTHPEAYKLMDEAQQAEDPGSPRNWSRMVEANPQWYAVNSARTLNRFLELVVN